MEAVNLPRDTIPRQRSSLKKQVGYTTAVLRAVRLLFYIVLFTLIIATGVYSTLLLLSLVTVFAKSQDGGTDERTMDVVVVAVVHPSLNLLLAVLRLSFHQFQQPKLKKIIIIFVVEAMATSGEVMLLFKAFPYMDSLSIWLSTLCLACVPALLQCIEATFSVIRRHCELNWLSVRNTFEILPFIIQVLCFTCLMVFVVIPNKDHKDINDNNNSTSDLVYILTVAIVMKSLGFYENFIRIKKMRRVNEAHNETDLSTSIKSRNMSDHDIEDLKDDRQRRDNETQLYKATVLLEKNNTTYIMFYKSCAKLAVYIIFVLYFIFNNRSLTQTDYETDDVQKKSSDNSSIEECSNSSDGLWYCFMNFYFRYQYTISLIIASTIFSYASSLACRLNMQKICFCIPLSVIPLISAICIAYMCETATAERDTGLQFVCVERDIYDYGVIFALASGLWIAIGLSTWHIWVPYIKMLPPQNRLFHVPFTDALFPVVNAHLRRKNDSDIQYATPPEKKEVPKVNVCVTMWHESPKEMIQLLKSLFKLDNKVLERKAERKAGSKLEKEEIDMEFHIVFDNAFEASDDTDPELNVYAIQFLDCVETAMGHILGEEKCLDWLNNTACREKSPMPYGGRLTWTLPGGTKMLLHLKDKRLVRIKKRSSQVMYMYYSLLFGHDHLTEEDIRLKLKHTFVLTLDGDVDFEPECVWHLIYRMQLNPDVGAVSGRVHPIGSGPIVWYQRFEYSMINWLNKATEHIFGCVLCCSGCFSLYRGSAIVADNVLKTYTRLPTKGKDLLDHEQGEDRWLCYLVQKQGYKVEFCPDADAKTFAPETLRDFYTQRNRWNASTILHNAEIIRFSKELIFRNANFSIGFIIYMSILFILEILSPSLIINSINGRLAPLLGIHSTLSMFLLFVPIIVFGCVCIFCKRHIQLIVAGIFTSYFALIMIALTVYLLIDIRTSSIFRHNYIFTVFVLAVCIIAAMLHPKEMMAIIYAPFYYVLMPATYVFMTVFYLCNMNEASWGTRESLKDDSGVSEYTFDREEQWLDSPSVNSFMLVQLVHENEFWCKVVQNFLRQPRPDLDLALKFKKELYDLRAKWIMVYIVANTISLSALLVMSSHREQIVADTLPDDIEPDLLFIEGIFSLIILFQLFGMIVHRWRNLLHLIANTTLGQTRVTNVSKVTPVNHLRTLYSPAEKLRITKSLEPASYYHMSDNSLKGNNIKGWYGNTPRSTQNNVSQRPPSAVDCLRRYLQMPLSYNNRHVIDHSSRFSSHLKQKTPIVQNSATNHNRISGGPSSEKTCGASDHGNLKVDRLCENISTSNKRFSSPTGYTLYKGRHLMTSIIHPCLSWTIDGTSARKTTSSSTSYGRE